MGKISIPFHLWGGNSFVTEVTSMKELDPPWRRRHLQINIPLQVQNISFRCTLPNHSFFSHLFLLCWKHGQNHSQSKSDKFNPHPEDASSRFPFEPTNYTITSYRSLDPLINPHVFVSLFIMCSFQLSSCFKIISDKKYLSLKWLVTESFYLWFYIWNQVRARKP